MVWGFWNQETPADAFAAGFMPGLAVLERWYLGPAAPGSPGGLGSHVGESPCAPPVRLAAVRADPQVGFTFSEERRARWFTYAEARWGAGDAPERLERVISGAVITHVLHFTDDATGTDAGRCCSTSNPEVGLLLLRVL